MQTNRMGIQRYRLLKKGSALLFTVTRDLRLATCTCRTLGFKKRSLHVRIQWGERRSGPPLKITSYIGFYRN